MAKDIKIIPTGAIINFFDASTNQTNWVIESGTLKFKRGATTYLSMDNTYPNYRVSSSDLKIGQFVKNNSGNVIDSQGWMGNPESPGPTGPQGDAGAT